MITTGLHYLAKTHILQKHTKKKKHDDQSSYNCKPICCVRTEEPDGSQRDGGLTCGNAKLTVHMQVESDLLHFLWRILWWCWGIFRFAKISGLTWRRSIFEKERIWFVFWLQMIICFYTLCFFTQFCRAVVRMFSEINNFFTLSDSCHSADI